MGCWCATDGITQLPINYDDRIKLFVLVHSDLSLQKLYGNGTCYSNDIWSPLCCISGNYNDYGGIENIDHDINYQLLSEDFKNNCSKNISVEKVINSIVREEPIEYKYMGKTTLGIMMVLEDVYKSMISFNPIIFKLNQYQNGIYKPRNNSIKENIYEWYDNCYNEFQNKKDPTILLKNNLNCLDYKNIFTELYRNLFYNYIGKGKNINDVDVQLALNSFFEILAFSDSMRLCRKIWQPQTGCGSQDNDLQIYKQLSKTIDNIIASREELMEELPDENGYYPSMIEYNDSIK